MDVTRAEPAPEVIAVTSDAQSPERRDEARSKQPRPAHKDSPIARLAMSQPAQQESPLKDGAQALAVSQQIEQGCQPPTRPIAADAPVPKYSWAALGNQPPWHEVLMYYLITLRFVFWSQLDVLASRPPKAGSLITSLPHDWFPLTKLGLLCGEGRALDLSWNVHTHVGGTRL